MHANDKWYTVWDANDILDTWYVAYMIVVLYEIQSNKIYANDKWRVTWDVSDILDTWCVLHEIQMTSDI
jgi:diadenosine tetraphosphate (Ap4A) HIT family hydrolase